METVNCLIKCLFLYDFWDFCCALHGLLTSMSWKIVLNIFASLKIIWVLIWFSVLHVVSSRIQFLLVCQNHKLNPSPSYHKTLVSSWDWNTNTCHMTCVFGSDYCVSICTNTILFCDSLGTEIYGKLSSAFFSSVSQLFLIFNFLCSDLQFKIEEISS